MEVEIDKQTNKIIYRMLLSDIAKLTYEDKLKRLEEIEELRKKLKDTNYLVIEQRSKKQL